MDWHNTTLDHYEFMQDMLDRGKQLQDEDPQTVYYIEAYIGKERQWTAYAHDEEERKVIIRDAVEAGFTYTVETEIQ